MQCPRALGPVALILVLLLAGRAEAKPRLALIESSQRTTRERLVTSGPAGQARKVLANGGLPGRVHTYPFSQPSWSRDGIRLAFSRAVGNRRLGVGARLRIFVKDVESGAMRMVPGTRGGFDPVFSPDGMEIAFTRSRVRTRPTRFRVPEITYLSRSGWIADLGLGTTRQLTPWRDGLENSPSSFSPDGGTLAISRHVLPNRYQAVALRLDGSGSSVIARHALDPVYSPDGKRVAFARGRWGIIRHPAHGAAVGVRTDLFTARADGTGLKRLTVTPRVAERFPDWDPSGKRLVYTRTNVRWLAGDIGTGTGLAEVNADGSCNRRYPRRRGSVLYGASWRPGPSRGAGPIKC